MLPSHGLIPRSRSALLALVGVVLVGAPGHAFENHVTIIKEVSVNSGASFVDADTALTAPSVVSGSSVLYRI